jgi:hypothetical protein
MKRRVAQKGNRRLTNRYAPGRSYYLDELRRTEAVRAEAASYKLAYESNNLAKRVLWLTIANTACAGPAVVIAIVALFLH